MQPNRPEIDFRTMKLIVGLIALGLSTITLIFSADPLTSISAAYCEGGTARDSFVGLLFAIAAIMTAHNGANDNEFFASKIAACSAIGIALIPTECDGIKGSPWHFIAAAIMFADLAWFCWSFYQRAGTRARKKEAARRQVVYGVCGVGIVFVMIVIGTNTFLHFWPAPNAVFILEAIGLALFGVSWLVASHFLPFFEHPTERMHLRPDSQELRPPSVTPQAER